MIFNTEAMLVADYGIWDIDGRPVTNKAGEPVEYVQVIDLQADEIHRFTLRGVADSDRVAQMQYAELTCEARTAQKGRDDGSVTSKLKVAVVGMKKANAPSSARSSSSS